MHNNIQTSYSIYKTYLLALIPIAIILIIATAMLYNIFKNSIEQDKDIQIRSGINLCYSDIKHLFDRFHNVGTNFNSNINILQNATNTSNEKILKRLMQTRLQQTPEIISFWVWFPNNNNNLQIQNDSSSSFSKTNNGIFLRCYKKTSQLDATNYDTVYFQKLDSNELYTLENEQCITAPMAHRMPHFSTPRICNFKNMLSESVDIKIASFSYPIFDEHDNIIGVSGIDINFDDIVKSVRHIRSNVIIGIRILSKDGYYLALEDTTLWQKHISDNPIYASNKNIPDSILKRLSQDKPITIEIRNEVLELNDTLDRQNIVHYDIIKLMDPGNTSIIVAIHTTEPKFNVDYYETNVSLLYYSATAITLILLLIFTWIMLVANVLRNRLYILLNEMLE